VLSIGTDIDDLEWPWWRNSPYCTLFHQIRYIRRPITSQWL